MTPVDRDILEMLQNGDERELVLTPGVLAENIDWGRGTVRNHLQKLREHGMVTYYDEERSLYQLSERGREYLAGDLDVAELEEE